jgi:hypothetical protein
VQRNIRKLAIFVGLPLAAIALAVFLLGWGTGSGQKAHAAVDSNVNFNLSATGCNTDPTPTKCSVNAGGTATISFNVTSVNTAGYKGYDLLLDFSGNVNYNIGSLVEQGAGVWPTCDQPTGELFPTGTVKPNAATEEANGSLSTSCVQGVAHPNPTMYTGTLLTFGITCKSSGSGTLSIEQGDTNTDLVDATLASHSEAAAGVLETLTINCVPAANTATPVPTSTPPSIPFVQKLPALQNVFLTRQGAKIPPQTCAAGTDVGVLNETLGGPISTTSKGVLQHIGAFEFEMRFDAKLVCVSVVAGPMFSGANATCSTLTSPDKGLVRFGCFTIGKNSAINGPGVLAVISVRPQPELYSQMRPGQSNGIPVQILNQGCQLSDDQGIAIPISSCEDADITFRFLEGDVTGPDCAVNSLDAQNIAMRWGATKGNLLYNSFLDLSPTGHGLNGDGRIDIQDLQFVFGRLSSVGTRSKGGNTTCPLTGTAWPPQPPVNPKAP